MKNIVYLLFFILPYHMIPLFSIGNFNLKFIDVITICVAYVSLLLFLYKRFKFRFNIIDYGVIFYVAYSIINIFIANSKLDSIADFYRLTVSIIAYFVISLYYKNISLEKYKTVFIKCCKVWIFNSIILTGYSIFIFLKYGLNELKAFGVLAINSFNVRFSGLHPDPNLFAIYLIISFAILVELFKIHQVKKVYFRFSVIVITVSILFTFSRSGILMFLIYLLLMIGKGKNGFILKLKIFTALICLFAIVYTINPFNFRYFIQNRFLNVITQNDYNGDVAINSRKLYYDIAKEEFKSSPLLGIGRGNYLNSAQKIYYNIDQGANPQSLIYQLLSEMGIVGTVVFMGIYFILILYMHKLKKSKNTKISFITNLNFNILILYFIGALFGSFDSTKELWYIFAMSSSVIYQFKHALSKNEIKETNNIKTKKKKLKIVWR